MIKKLQRRFVLTVLLAVFIVFSSIMLVINIINYNNVKTYADEILTTLSNNDGIFSNFPKPGKDSKWGPQITGETPFETRYFAIRFDTNKNVISVNTKNIVMVDYDEAISYAIDALDNSSGKNGYIDYFRYTVKNNDNNILVIFVDCNRQLMTANNFLKTSIIVSLIAIFAITVLVIIFSKKVIAPISNSYIKQRKFITDASHELKTPLTIINANVELLELEKGENEYTNVIQKQISRLAQMTKNLVLLSKIDEEDLGKEKNVFSLSDAIIDTIESFKKVMERNNKELVSEVNDDINYNGNENLIRQLLSILLDNANKYSLSKTNVKLSKNKGDIILEVSNDTKGIEIGNLNKYCDRFYRTDESRASNIDGSGIGLSIAKEIAIMHKANMNIYSEDGINYIVKIIF